MSDDHSIIVDTGAWGDGLAKAIELDDIIEANDMGSGEKVAAWFWLYVGIAFGQAAERGDLAAADLDLYVQGATIRAPQACPHEDGDDW